MVNDVVKAQVPMAVEHSGVAELSLGVTAGLPVDVACAWRSARDVHAAEPVLSWSQTVVVAVPAQPRRPVLVRVRPAQSLVDDPPPPNPVHTGTLEGAGRGGNGQGAPLPAVKPPQRARMYV